MRAAVSLFFLAILAAPFAAQAQGDSSGSDDPMAARLSAERVGGVETGAYTAGDKLNFFVTPYGDKFLLRFEDSPENFVLFVDRIALGGKVMKYDTGATALRVSVWGGLTLYTEGAPGGLPATRVGESVLPPRAPVTENDMHTALGDAQSHLSYVQKLTLHFSVDPAVSAGGDDARALAFDALVNAETGIERVIASAAGRQALTHRIDSVKIVEGDKPSIALSGKTLMVSFAPAAGLAGRASSRAITFALGKMLAVSEPA